MCSSDLAVTAHIDAHAPAVRGRVFNVPLSLNVLSEFLGTKLLVPVVVAALSKVNPIAIGLITGHCAQTVEHNMDIF